MSTEKNLDPALARLLDANLNRALEGLRTLEDVARFALNHTIWSTQFKQLRHSLVEMAKVWPREFLLSHRDVVGDVGVEIKTTQELQRQGFGSLIAAASGRTQQSLRVLEECSKESFPLAAKSFEKARYETYRLSALLETHAISQERLKHALLYVLTDAAGSDQEIYDRVSAYAEAGAKIVQLREKHLADALLFRRAEQAVAAARAQDAILIVNDRADIAAAAHADGVHVGQTELPIHAVRKVVGRHRLVGVSTRSVSDLRRAIDDGADYVGCGPTFTSTTKSFAQFAGLDYLRQVATNCTIPAYAIGGIDLNNLQTVLNTGIRRVAVSGAVGNAANPIEVIRQLNSRLRE